MKALIITAVILTFTACFLSTDAHKRRSHKESSESVEQHLKLRKKTEKSEQGLGNPRGPHGCGTRKHCKGHRFSQSYCFHSQSKASEPGKNTNYQVPQVTSSAPADEIKTATTPAAAAAAATTTSTTGRTDGTTSSTLQPDPAAPEAGTTIAPEAGSTIAPEVGTTAALAVGTTPAPVSGTSSDQTPGTTVSSQQQQLQ
ncbi:mucin-5AC-like [Erinaceus europaeus]|uniref:Mucin-5AC-like n=1 Tax=Erinaceus europaeus TaxID=9365 RepID=A0ABM3X707_ERIEU|nr:mucin-5AC-like [Erinaceus europaeus]XP_060044599.1 mucin-5AC-like [Erinaceus europaeus]